MDIDTVEKRELLIVINGVMDKILKSEYKKKTGLDAPEEMPEAYADKTVTDMMNNPDFQAGILMGMRFTLACGGVPAILSGDNAIFVMKTIILLAEKNGIMQEIRSAKRDNTAH